MDCPSGQIGPARSDRANFDPFRSKPDKKKKKRKRIILQYLTLADSYSLCSAGLRAN